MKSLKEYLLFDLIRVLLRDVIEICFQSDSFDAILNMLWEFFGEHIFELYHRLEKQLTLDILIGAVVVNVNQAGMIYV